MTGIPWELARDQTEPNAPALHMTRVPQKAGLSVFAPLTLQKIFWDSAENDLNPTLDEQHYTAYWMLLFIKEKLSQNTATECEKYTP